MAKVIIAGSRSINNYHKVSEIITDSGFIIDEVISGGANGVDKLGEEWAKDAGKPIKQFLPDWNKYGKQAGILRNIEMANYADCLIAIWDGKSKGTKHMIKCAEEKGLLVYVEKSQN